MKKPVLLIMAAGMGSRYGGMKQIDPVDEYGHPLMEYSVFDARRAGFETVVCVIKKEMEKDFHERIGRDMARQVDLKYAFQSLNDLPDGFSLPEGRVKPWGTAHAVLSARDVIDGPFSAINADDFYGMHAYASVYDFLAAGNGPSAHAMVGYRVENTLTENGSVARGICRIDKNHNLTDVVERTRIEPAEGGARFTEDGEHFTFLPSGTIVSMNMWGFGAGMMGEIGRRFGAYLKENLPVNPLKCEYFLPLVANQLIQAKAATVRVLPTHEKWYGMTYTEDKPALMAAIRKMKGEGMYPERLWED